MTKKLVWRLGKLPTPEELVELVKNKIITQEEAKQILFSSETEEDRDKKSLESEIKFLRELVEKLSDKTRIVETIRTIEKPYYTYGWYSPYQVWCSSTPTFTTTATYTSGTTNITNALNTNATTYLAGSVGSAGSATNTVTKFANNKFSDIKTF